MAREPDGGAVKVEISVLGDDTTVTADLYQWLRDDPGIRRHAELELVSTPGDGTAMGALEVISLVLDQGFAAANLGFAYAAWRAARPTAPPLTVTVEGRQLTVSGGSEEEVARLVRALTDTAEDEDTAEDQDTAEDDDAAEDEDRGEGGSEEG
ncbi:effector-associated constant component EACC1 [Streptomyces sp. CA-250714]|uniref:effector-associated constant component EACC1 n=1 Tax=Streptomyces sp. CA-250714 TaxID=3240060 RepID=UPI003D8E7A6C